jgi:hypothetical protein
MALKTQGVYDLVAEVMRGMREPYGEDIIEVLAQLVTTLPELRIVLVSVEGSAHHFAQPLPSAVRALLVKPISGEVLAGTVLHVGDQGGV